MKTRHYYPNGNVERGTATARNPRPGYRWVPAYSEALPRGFSQPLPRREIQAMARRDGERAVFHETEDDARQAITQ